MIGQRDIQVTGFSRSTTFAWPMVQMRDVCVLKYGKALKAEVRVTGPVPVYGSNGQTGWHAESLGRGPTVILGRKGQGNLGVKWCDGPFWVIDTAYYVEFSDKLDPRFFYFFSDYVGLNHLKDGTSNPSLGRDTFYAQYMPLPTLREQRSIAEALANFDDKIELNRRRSETLEAMALAIYRDWFVDFGPIHRKVAGAVDPIDIMGGLAPSPAVAAKLATLFPDSFNDQGLPNGWSECAIGDLVEISGGSTPSTTDESLWQPAEYRWATPKDLSNMSDLALFDTGRRISSLGLAKIRSGLLQKGTVLLSSRAPIGYLAIAQAPVAINQGFIALKPTADCGSAYLYLWCKANIDAILANANGSTFQEISKKNFGPIRSPIPNDREILRAFGDITQPLIDCIVSAAAETHILTQTRDYLLPRLMSGEVRVDLPDRSRD